jgi:tetratricopeptide (TPR) repeat protein
MKHAWLAILMLTVTSCVSKGATPAAGMPDTTVLPLELSLPPEWTKLPTLTSTIYLSPTPTVFVTATRSAGENLELQKRIETATSLTKSGRYDDALELWDQILSDDSDNADAYYGRATCYYQSIFGERSFDNFLRKLDHALQDVDTAIGLRNDIGDYYSMRERIYLALADIADLQVDSIYLVNIALDNARKAAALGTTIDELADRTVITDMIYAGKCTEALPEIDTLLNKLAPGDTARGGLLTMRSLAYSCLGRLQDALQTVEDAMWNNQNMDYKNWLKAVYLFQLERYDDALPIINHMIACCSSYGGERYYLRAALYYGLGKTDQAEQDLSIGMGNTWSRNAILPYVEGKLALDAGDKETAIAQLQYAEASLPSYYYALRSKIQTQLDELGASPLQPTLSTHYTGTPIP